MYVLGRLRRLYLKNFLRCATIVGPPLRPFKQFMADVLYINVSGDPKEDEYFGFINSQKCKLRRKKLKEKSNDFMLKENVRKQKWIANIRKNPRKRKNTNMRTLQSRQQRKHNKQIPK